MGKIQGKAFARGFYNKVVFQGSADYQSNRVELNGYNWNQEQLLAHEAVHCYQNNKFGFWKSNPIANIPDWKWEGYPEYISSQNTDQIDLYENIYQFLKVDPEKAWAIKFSDGTVSPVNYYSDWLMVQYCIDVKGFSYAELLNNQTGKGEMTQWFDDEQKKRDYNEAYTR
ncbi:hypothetical protein [Maribellus maritimus]|uniref:hypothetical protein n=1 Tax=Maribellus maritimus TaxID=2870838 RepID=UPI001EEBD19E|nr:hypothetical protein [Maribellus maritimus]MCG6187668.1 hypothetical protein [Maribellus maritimus]